MTSIESIAASDTLTLQAVNESHVPALHQMVLRNQTWLQQHLDWPRFVTSELDTQRNVQGNVMLHQRGIAKMFIIFDAGEMAGVLSFNQIEPANKTGYIGYWLDERAEGKGIISASLQAFMHYYAERGEVRRFVIKCRVDNARSNQVALRNGFALEGCLRQAECLNGVFYDQNLYARIIDKSAL